MFFCSNTLSAGFVIKGGITLANLRYSEPIAPIFELNTKNLRGFQAGAFFNLSISRYIDIQPEFYFTMKGARIKETIFSNGDIADIEAKIKLNYFEIPLLLKFNIPTNGKARFGVFAGPYVAFNLSAKIWAKVTVNVGGVVESEEEEEDFKEDVESLDYGIVMGACMEFGMGSGLIILDVRYSLGLANIGKDTDPDEGWIKNKAFVFMIGFGFD